MRIKIITTIFLLVGIAYSCRKDPPPSLPMISTDSVTNISKTTAFAKGTITKDGGAKIIARGICWGLTPDPEIKNNRIDDNKAEIGTFNCSITMLSPNTTYHIRAFATNSAGTSYGKNITFKTDSLKLPVVITSAVDSITTKKAVSGGTITSDGGSPITTKGVCWGTTTNPTTSDTKTQNGNGTGTFYSLIANLTPNTTYHVRAYATNGVGTSYGENKLFKTRPAVLPTLNTLNIDSIMEYSAMSGGSIISDGGDSITEKGICWSTMENPTYNLDTKVPNFENSRNYKCPVLALQPGTKYFVRAFARNSAGIAYGNQINFTTKATLPFICFNPIDAESIDAYSAKIGANIFSDGGSPILEKGICWSSTNVKPTIADSKTSEGTGISTFTSILSNLTPNTKYYVRSYARNKVGIRYATTCNDYNLIWDFTTLPIRTPELSTFQIKNIQETSANTNCIIYSDGRSKITSKGVCYSTTSTSPTINDNIIKDLSTIGTININITNLKNNTIYYVRPFATNNAGTGYREVQSFKTKSSFSGTVTDIDGNTYRTILIGNQIWMAANLKVTKFNDGTPINKTLFDFYQKEKKDPTNLEGTYSNYGNNVEIGNIYGKLYDCYVVKSSKNVCPTNWHIPTKNEWEELINYKYLGGIYSIVPSNSPLKEPGTNHWNEPNSDATNQSGFTAYAAGKISRSNTLHDFNTIFFNEIGISTTWWTSSSSTSSAKNTFSVNISNYSSSSYINQGALSTNDNGWAQYSIRCIKD